MIFMFEKSLHCIFSFRVGKKNSKEFKVVLLITLRSYKADYTMNIINKDSLFIMYGFNRDLSRVFFNHQRITVLKEIRD